MLSIIFLSLTAHAATLQQNLLKMAMPLVRTVTPGRELHLYNWAQRQAVLNGKDQTPFIAGEDNRVRSYIGFLRDMTYIPGTNGGMMGGGVYAATDPIATQSFGGNDWILTQFVVQGGTRFLNLSGISTESANQINQMFAKFSANANNSPTPMPSFSPRPPGPGEFSAETLKQVAATGCTAETLSALWSNANLPSCKMLRDQVTSMTNVSAIEYSYVSSMIPAVCPIRPRVAFVLFGDLALNWNRQSYFSTALPTPDDHLAENRRIIEAVDEMIPPIFPIFNPATNTFTPATTSPPIWPALSGQKPLTTNMPQWIQKSLFGCGSFPEDL